MIMLSAKAFAGVGPARNLHFETTQLLVTRVRQLSTENRLFCTPQPSIHAGFRFLDA